MQRPIRCAPFNEGVGERSAVLLLFSSTEREMGLVIRELARLAGGQIGRAKRSSTLPHRTNLMHCHGAKHDYGSRWPWTVPGLRLRVSCRRQPSL